MRELKFRAWDKDKGAYVYIDSLYWFEEELVHSFNDPGYDFEQFTGLLDKTGREIYEGDIIRTGRDTDEIQFERIHEITWDYFTYWLREYGYGNIERDPEKWHDDTTEVIGNIHENPELLDQHVQMPSPG